MKNSEIRLDGLSLPAVPTLKILHQYNQAFGYNLDMKKWENVKKIYENWKHWAAQNN